MAQRRTNEIVIPDVRDYREGLPVLSTYDPSKGRIVIPQYEGLGSRVLHPLARLFRR